MHRMEVRPRPPLAVARLRALATLLAILWLSAGAAAPLPAAGALEGLKLLERNDPQSVGRARGIFSEVLAGRPDDEQAHAGLVYVALLEYLSGRKRQPAVLQDGLAHADAVLRGNPRQEDVRYKKSQMLFFLDRPEEGLRNLEEGLRQVPDSESLHEALLVYLLNLGRIEEAARFSSGPGPAVGDPASLRMRFGRAWLKAGRALEARESFQASNRLRPSREASDGITRTYVLAEDPAGAARHLEAHAQAYPDDLDALESLALLYEEQGERIKARLSWTKLRARAVDAETGRRAAERLEELK